MKKMSGRNETVQGGELVEEGKVARVGGQKHRSRKLISTPLRQERIGLLYHARNIHHVGIGAIRKGIPDTKHAAFRNIVLALNVDDADGRRRRRSACTTGGRRDAHSYGKCFFSTISRGGAPLLFLRGVSPAFFFSRRQQTSYTRINAPVKP